MTYREILTLYKDGKLNEEEQKKVEKDIEKQDAISEYLFAEGEIPDLNSLEDTFFKNDASLEETLEKEEEGQQDQETQFVKMIRQSIRKAFIKMGVLIGGILLCIVLLVIFVLPQMVSKFYYNPGKVVKSNESYTTNQISLDMAVYSDAYLPGYYRDSVTVNERGYGCYEIMIQQTLSRNGIFTNNLGTIERNHMLLYNSNLLTRPVDNVFLPCEGVNEESTVTMEDESTKQMVPVGAAGTVKEAKEAIHALSNEEEYIAYISLKKLTSYKDFISFVQTKDYADLWANVFLNDGNNNNLIHNIGFQPSPSGSPLLYDKKKYPSLSLLDGNVDAMKSESVATEHFISSLQYLDDNQKFLELVGKEEKEEYQKAISIVKKNGMAISGFAIVGKKAEIESFFEDEKVAYIYTQPMQ